MSPTQRGLHPALTRRHLDLPLEGFRLSNATSGGVLDEVMVATG